MTKRELDEPFPLPFHQHKLEKWVKFRRYDLLRFFTDSDERSKVSYPKMEISSRVMTVFCVMRWFFTFPHGRMRDVFLFSFQVFFFFLCSSLKWVSHVHMKTRQIRMNSFTRNARISAHPILLESPQSFLLYFSDANSKNPHLAKITIFSSFAEKFPV